ncbi:MAG: threonine ammonia-lyase, biosynthetic [Miltoncostaeaceae bacterium]
MTDTDDYLRRILTARVYDIARVTPLDEAPELSDRLGRRVLLKREDEQPVHSFKVRGAYNRMAQLTPGERARGVIAASAGNHAQGVAVSAARLDCEATIVMPVTTPRLKVDAVRHFGGERVRVVLVGDSYSESQAHAEALVAERDLVFIHPFDDPAVIAGQGTVAIEILRQCHGPIDAILVAVGGGGLIGGIAAYVKALHPDIRIVGVQTPESDAMARSLDAGARVTLDDVGLFSDGTAVKRVGEETFRLAQRHVDAMIRVDNDAICAAIKDVFQDTRSILEPAGALAVAGLKEWATRAPSRGGALVAVAGGANMNFSRLRAVAERAEVGEAREALFAVTIPEERGAFLRFCATLDGHSVTEFNYRIADGESAHLFVGLQIAGRADASRMARTLRETGFPALDLTDDELAKQHLRHMIGGRSPRAVDELVYRFEFPERPGALLRFLQAMSPNWNISMFHYRHEGAGYGHVLVGLQVPPAEMAAFESFLATLGYPYRPETGNPAYRLFLGG